MFKLDKTEIKNAEKLLGIRQGLFPRGFIYGPAELQFPELLDHYEQVQVPRGFLYIDGTRLNLQQASEADTTLVILGRMTSLLANNPDDHAEHLLRSFLTSEEELHEALDWCAGRYVILIFHGDTLRVYHDFLATRSVYFHSTEGLISSHGKLLALFAEKLTPQTGILAGAQSYRWWDTSEYEEVFSLLSNHYLFSGAGDISVHRYWPRDENRQLGLGLEDICTEIVTLWQRSLTRLSATTDTISLSLTGGQDSRLMLSMAHNVIPDLKCFTYMPLESRLAEKENFWTATYKQDFAIVKQLAKLLGLDHQVLRQSSDSPSETEIANLLSANRVGSRHGYWVVQTLLNHFEPNQAVHIRGNFIESLRGAAAVNHAESDMSNVLGILDQLQRRTFAVSQGIRQEDRERLNMGKLEQFGYFDLPASWERSSFFFAEARTPQWHAEMANDQDVVFDTYLPHNNRRIFELFWATPMAERRDGIVVKDLINATVPLLNFFPVNNEDTLYDSWRKLMTEGVQRTKLIDDWLPQIGVRNLISSQPLQRVTLKGELEEKTFILHNGGFHIPAAALPKAGYMESQDFVVPVGANVAEFVLRLPYSNEAGAGRIRFDVHLNDAVVGSFDPAVTPMISLIRIEHLQAGDVIRYVLSSNVKREAVSWRRASLSQVSRINFLAEELDEAAAPDTHFGQTRVPVQLTAEPLSGTS